MSTMDDNPPGFHRFDLNKTVWIVTERYTKLNGIGTGAYGQVCSSMDTSVDVQVAIKKLSRPFQSVMHAKRALREIRLLKHMRHENVIGLLDLFSPQNTVESLTDVYMVTPLMGADLTNIIRVQMLSDEHVQFLMYQIFRAFKYIHSAKVIHRDLKPGNIAVNENCELKVLDFGLARHSDDSMTGYVATRWYRAPEIMLNWMAYNEKVDIWSCGCIMAELLTQKVLFPGDDHIDQLTRIMKLVGKPDAELMSKISSDNARNYIASMPNYERKNFDTIFPNASPAAKDLLTKTLRLDPDSRLSAEEALEHPYFSAYHDPEDEPISEPFLDGEGSKGEVMIAQLKELVFKEIQNFEPPPPDDEEMM